MVSTIPHPYTKKDALFWINKCKNNIRKKSRESYDFGIELIEGKGVIGGVGLISIDYFNQRGEIGCWLGQNYWRKGIMSEATGRLIDFGFNEIKLRKLVWKAYSTNKASNALAKKLGFKLEGILKKDTKCLATGKIHDSNLYGMLKKDWLKHRKKIIKK